MILTTIDHGSALKPQEPLCTSFTMSSVYGEATQQSHGDFDQHFLSKMFEGHGSQLSQCVSFFILVPLNMIDRVAVEALQSLFGLLTCSSSLFVNKSALMLSIEAARYIIRISPCTGALLSTLKKGRDPLAPFYRKWLRAAIFSLRLCMSFSIFGCSTSVMDFTFEGLARIPCLVMRFPKNGHSLTSKEHFFRLSFMLIDRNFSKVYFIYANISSCHQHMPQGFFLFDHGRPYLPIFGMLLQHSLIQKASKKHFSQNPKRDSTFQSILGISVNCNGSRDPCHISMGTCEDICIGLQEVGEKSMVRSLVWGEPIPALLSSVIFPRGLP
uniref:Uncharacterized protein n=1 Tax=Tanacetum cinerariifolium TaxID=118510 RepID=A0A6L2LLB9_TANCI|nr:hypothetical protein [Tanacetum cinerariifolium]